MKRLADRLAIALADGPPGWYYAGVAVVAAIILVAGLVNLCHS